MTAIHETNRPTTEELDEASEVSKASEVSEPASPADGAAVPAEAGDALLAEAVSVTTSGPQALAEPGEQIIWRRAAIGAVIGFLFTLVAVGGLGTLGGLNAAAAVGIGAFAGIWSGVGFGFMMGGTPVLAAYHLLDRPASERVNSDR